MLGLAHSDDPNDVMSPYYFADRIVLTANDKKAMIALREARKKPVAASAEQATKYVQQHKLETVLGDMLNSVLPTGTPRPLTAMSTYLADRAAEQGE